MFKKLFSRRSFLKTATAPIIISIKINGKKLTLSNSISTTISETSQFSSGKLLESGLYTVKIQDITFENSKLDGTPRIKFLLQEKETGFPITFYCNPQKAPEILMNFLSKFDRFNNLTIQDSINLDVFKGNEAKVKVKKDIYNNKEFNRILS